MKSKTAPIYLMFICVTLIFCPSLFAAGCEGALGSPIESHELQIMFSGTPIESVIVTDHFGDKTETILELAFTHGSGQISLRSASHVFDFADDISLAQVPKHEQMNFGMLKPIQEKYLKDPEFERNFGMINGVSMTNQHRSIVFFATDDGVYYRQTGSPIRIVIVNKRDHSITRVIRYQIPLDDRARLEGEIGLDIDRLILQFASSLDLVKSSAP